MASNGAPRDIWWAVCWLAGITAGASALLVVLLGPVHLSGSSGRVTAALAFVGVLVTAAASVIGLTVTRASSRASERRLRLDAAMRAGESFSCPTPETVSAASIASSLLALTKLDNADLAVALLVDFWPPGGEGKVSPEIAVLVVDAALRCGKPGAQLVAAELLCQNSESLDACKSLQWPSFIDGSWNPDFSPKTKILLIDALTRMTLAKKPASQSALRSITVRLYGIFEADPDRNLRGCVATLIRALLDALRDMEYKNFMQGTKVVMLRDLESAARWAKPNDDDYLARVVKERSKELEEWANSCTRRSPNPEHSELAEAIVDPIP